ncbi:MAG: acyl-protein synthetase [Idiomarina sp.]|nr:acyl-protein synthetase [Idiomarina sp.]
MNLIEQPPYGLSHNEKAPRLLHELKALTEHHRQACPAYARVLSAEGQWESSDANDLAQLPWLTVPLFKQRELRSIPDDAVFKVLTSSGTTGSVPSRIFLDNDTAKRQSQVLVRIMQEWLGKQRRPMLIWDHPSVIQNRASFSARGAGIQGLSFLGRHHTYALHDDMTLNLEAIRTFHKRFAGTPVFMFGFTFMVWRYGLQALQAQEIHLPFEDAVLLHSGGWKKLEAEAVSARIFNETARNQLGNLSVHNFYGMVEQVGSIFVACEHGHLHCPSYADILVREPGSWRVLPHQQAGVLQVLSVLPTSYPGHSLLTEDRGRILGEDDCPCGRTGKYFEALGRMAKVEARGCSDTFENAGGSQ